MNDDAERGISVIQIFNSILTVNEDQEQFLLHVVEQNTKLHSTDKSTVVREMSSWISRR